MMMILMATVTYLEVETLGLGRGGKAGPEGGGSNSWSNWVLEEGVVFSPCFLGLDI